MYQSLHFVNETEDHSESCLKHNYGDAEKVSLTQPDLQFRLFLMFSASECKDCGIRENLDEYLEKYRDVSVKFHLISRTAVLTRDHRHGLILVWR